MVEYLTQEISMPLWQLGVVFGSIVFSAYAYGIYEGLGEKGSRK